MPFSLTYHWQPFDPSIRPAANAKTVANLSLKVGEHSLTVNDRKGRDRADFVQVSVLPLAEFIATNWWTMLHEPAEKKRRVADQNAFDSRHWIDRHTDGFCFPRVGLFGAGSSVTIKADAIYYPSAELRFVGSLGPGADQDRIEREEVEAALLEFLKDVAARVAPGEDDDFLRASLDAILTSRGDPEEFDFCRCAGLLGANPYEEDNELAHTILSTVKRLGEGLALELFAMSEASAVSKHTDWLLTETRAVIKKSSESARYANSIKHYMRDALPDRGKPWDIGYQTARNLRHQLNIAPDEALKTLDEVAEILLGKAGAPFQSAGTEAGCGANAVGIVDGEGIGIAMDTNLQRRTAQFLLAATYCDYLFLEEQDIFLNTSAPSDRQKRNRAFAAEFLAPISGIRGRLEGKKPETEILERIAKDFGVSSAIVRYQLSNQGEDDPS